MTRARTWIRSASARAMPSGPHARAGAARGLECAREDRDRALASMLGNSSSHAEGEELVSPRRGWFGRLAIGPADCDRLAG
jgi:hypothetical protein